VKTRFYAWKAGQDAPPVVASADDVTASSWRPARDGLPPPALASLHNRIWWLFDRTGVFANRGCGVQMLHCGDRLVHTSLVTPRYFRFPEMGARDLQIGATWTDPEFRGRGYGKLAVKAIHDAWAGEFDQMWYLVEEDNTPSIRVIEACGYRLRGVGRRQALPGLGPLGQYKITDNEV
jgi:RimJ/RimL family protein N-acetyltransferase